MQNVGEISANRFYRTSSEATASNSIELPAEIDDLIDNKMYRNKFRKLVREGHLNDLLALAEIARTKNKPSFWFSRATRTTPIPGHESEPTFWQRSLKYLAKLREIAQQAAEIQQRLNATTEQVKTIYKACWRRSDAVLQAIKAEETGRERFKYFCWLCWRT